MHTYITEGERARESERQGVRKRETGSEKERKREAIVGYL
jgi:hypothetical protein